MTQLHVENLNSFPELERRETDTRSSQVNWLPVVAGVTVALASIYAFQRWRRSSKRSSPRLRIIPKDSSSERSTYWDNHPEIDRVDEASLESFPASDAPAWSP